MVLSHLFPKIWFVTLYLRDKKSSLHLEALRTSCQSDSEFLTPLWQWWSSCLLTELEGTRPWQNMDTAKHCKVHSARKWDPCGTDLPAWLKSDQASKVEENPHFSKNTNQHSAAGVSLHLDKSQRENDGQNFPNSHISGWSSAPLSQQRQKVKGVAGELSSGTCVQSSQLLLRSVGSQSAQQALLC